MEVTHCLLPGQQQAVRERRRQLGEIIHNPVLMRIQPREQRRAARRAERRGAKRIRKPHAFLREPVDVRRLHMRRAVAPERLRTEIVAEDEEDVGLVGRARDDKEDEKKEDGTHGGEIEVVPAHAHKTHEAAGYFGSAGRCAS